MDNSLKSFPNRTTAVKLSASNARKTSNLKSSKHQASNLQTTTQAKGKQNQKLVPPNFSRPLNTQAQASQKSNCLTQDPRYQRQHNESPKFANMQAFNFGTNPAASFKHLEFKDKSSSFGDKLKFWRPDSQVHVPAKTGLDENLQQNMGRVAAALTGQTAQEGVSHSISSQIENMRENASMSFSKHQNFDIAGGSNISIMSFMAPGTTTAIKNAGVEIGWGPSMAVDANIKHAQSNGVKISRDSAEKPSELSGHHTHQTDVKLNVSARIAAGLGTTDGAFIGPSIQGGVSTGVSHQQTKTYQYQSQETDAQTQQVMDFIATDGKESFSGNDWSAPEVHKDISIPLALKLEGSVIGKAPGYGDSEHSIKHSGGLGAAVSVGVGDVKHPQSSAFVKGEAGGSINTSVAGQSFNGSEGGALSGAHARLPQGLKIESEKTSLFAKDEGTKQAYHMSYVNHPFGHSGHANRLEEKYGKGTLDRLQQGFRDAFDHDDIPNRRKTVIEKTCDDGSIEFYGQVEATARQGKTHKIPAIPLSYSNYAEGNLNSDARLLFTLPPQAKI